MSEAMDGFVPSFAEDLRGQWSHGPRVFRNALRSPMFTEGDFMTGLLGAASDYVADPTAIVPPGRIYLGGELVKAERLASLLPRGRAESCDQYVTRIRQAHPQDAIGIVLDNCEKHVPAMRTRLIPVLHQLFSRVGYPARRNHLCIYAGNYRSTPFGIHRDDCHVLMFCLTGRKSMAFWPRAYFDEKRELFVNGKVRARLSDHIAAGTVLEMGPLDVLYWSADDYHVAVSDTDDFHAALSVGIYHQGSGAEIMKALDVLADITRLDGPDVLDIQALPGAPNGRLSAEELYPTSRMAGFFRRWEQLREVVNRPQEADYRALRLALGLISSAGYGNLRTPPASPLGTLVGSVLRCDVPESLVVARIRGGLIVGANGSRFFYDQAPPAIEDVVLQLRDRMPHRFDAAIASADAAVAPQVAAVIRDLITAGGLSMTAEDVPLS